MTSVPLGNHPLFFAGITSLVLSVVLQGVSTGTTYWLTYGSVHYGIFRACDAWTCYKLEQAIQSGPFVNASGWLNSVRAFEVLSILSYLATLITLIIFMVKNARGSIRSKIIYIIAVCLCVSAAFSSLVGYTIAVAKTQAVFEENIYDHLDYSSYLCLGAATMGILASIFIGVSGSRIVKISLGEVMASPMTGIANPMMAHPSGIMYPTQQHVQMGGQPAMFMQQPVLMAQSGTPVLMVQGQLPPQYTATATANSVTGGLSVVPQEPKPAES